MDAFSKRLKSSMAQYFDSGKDTNSSVDSNADVRSSSNINNNRVKKQPASARQILKVQGPILAEVNTVRKVSMPRKLRLKK